MKRKQTKETEKKKNGRQRKENKEKTKGNGRKQQKNESDTDCSGDLFCEIQTWFPNRGSRLLAEEGLRGPATRLFAIVSLNSFVLVFFSSGHRTIIARNIAKWGIAQMCLCKIKYHGAVSHHSGGVLTSLEEHRAIWGITAIASQCRVIWGH